jgi:hypothetical protein
MITFILSLVVNVVFFRFNYADLDVNIQALYVLGCAMMDLYLLSGGKKS